ncbi:MAG TPA: NUDIX hydrolase [Firmicutes bacterium]|nr:NUDIX hydrolase [Bacillota bacterium]
MKTFEEKQLSTKEYYKNSFLKVTQDEVLLPDGFEAHRVVVHHPGGVNLIALDEQNRLLLVEQFRYPVGKSILETPAGKIEPNEATIMTAKRELEEETGYTSDDLTMIGRIATTPGFCTEYIENYLVKNITPLQTLVKGDDDEFITLHKVTKAEALKLMESGDICDFKTIYAIQYLIIHCGW